MLGVICVDKPCQLWIACATCDQGLHTAVRTTGLGECAVLPPLQSVQSEHHAPSSVHHTYGTNEQNAVNLLIIITIFLASITLRSNVINKDLY